MMTNIPNYVFYHELSRIFSKTGGFIGNRGVTADFFDYARLKRFFRNITGIFNKTRIRYN